MESQKWINALRRRNPAQFEFRLRYSQLLRRNYPARINCSGGYFWTSYRNRIDRCATLQEAVKLAIYLRENVN